VEAVGTLPGEGGFVDQQWDGTYRSNGRIEAIRGRDVELVNFHRTQDERQLRATFDKKEALENNLAALGLLAALRKESRLASQEEQTVLSKYVGFGGLSEILLNPSNNAQWSASKTADLQPYFKQIHGLIVELDTDGTALEKVRASVLNAHYTPYHIINPVHQALKETGFTGGRILEPSAGIGNFLSAIPIDVSEQSDVTAIELEPLTGAILSYLYPTANVKVSGFEDVPLPDDHFDLVISNVPFGDYTVNDKDLKYSGDEYAALKDASIHNYFFAKSILHAKENGVVALLTSRYTLDSSDTVLRELIASKCEFLGAIRLPNNTFKANAGASVVTDIVFLRKKGEKETVEHKTDFVNLKSERVARNDGREVAVEYNGYFHVHKDHMLGKVVPGGQFRDNDFNLVATLDESALGASIKKIATDILSGVKYSLNQSKAFELKNKRYVETNDFLQPGNIVLFKDGFMGVVNGTTYQDDKLDLLAKSVGINPNNLRDNSFSYEEKVKLEALGLTVGDFQNKEVESFRYSKEKAPFDALRLYIKLRTSLKELMVYESANESLEKIEAKRSELNSDYTSFVVRYGDLSGGRAAYIRDMDVDGMLLKSLEQELKLENGKRHIQKADIFSKRIITPLVYPDRVGSVDEAIIISMNKFGRLNQNLLCELLNVTQEELMAQERAKAEPKLFWDEKGRVFERDEYLSGEVVEKLNAIKEAMKQDPAYRINYNQLLLVQPLPISVENIYSPLEARWIPKGLILEFAKEVLSDSSATINYNKHSDELTVKAHGGMDFSTGRKSAEWVFNHAINGTEPLVKYTVKLDDGKTKEELDIPDTHLAKDKVLKIKQRWAEFKLGSKERREGLETLYNSTYNTTVVREKYDGSKYVLNGYYGPELRPHQRDTVYRNVTQAGGLNDHMVGSGKTLIQVCVANEVKRLGIANKVLIVGMKAQLPDMYSTYRKVYPTAKLLYPKEKDFEKSQRQKLLNSIATNNWDCVILTHEQFAKIRQPIEYHKKYIDKRLEEITFTIDDMEKSDRVALKSLESEKRKLVAKLDKLLTEQHKDRNVLDFKQLGFDFLIVDESHEFKNLEFTTKKKNIRGLGNTFGSARASNMKIACTVIQEKRGGDKGILFSSGTPICNTMGEMYLLKKYLRPNKLEKMGLDNFDKWCSLYTVNSPELEFYLGSFKSVNRMRQFENVPELMNFYKEFTDVKNDFNIKIEKPIGVNELVMVEPSGDQTAYLQMLNKFFESKGNDYRDALGLENGYDHQRRMNPSYAILVQTFARKLSLDPRLVDKDAAPGLKIQMAADLIYERYLETREHKGTQLVFCDLGTPKPKDEYNQLLNAVEEIDTVTETDMKYIFSNKNIAEIKVRAQAVLQLNETDFKDFLALASSSEKFSVYDELKKLLIEKGMPSDQVDFIHNHNDSDSKSALYKKMNDGDLALLMGSTKKLGTGTNVQERIVGMYHLDVPYRPDALEQRNGRGVRQGNDITKKYYDNKLPIKYLGTKETFDASMYELVSTKAAFIQSIKVNRDASVRVIKDVGEDIDLKLMGAILSGNPLHKEKEEVRQRIEELQMLKKSFLSQSFSAERRIEANEKLVIAYEKRVENLKAALPFVESIPLEADGTHKLVASVLGRPCETIKELGTNILGEVRILTNKNRPCDFQPIAKVFGFEVLASRDNSFGDMKRTIKSPHGGIIDQHYFADTEMANGLQIRNTIMGVGQEITVKHGQIEELLKQNTLLKLTVNEKFPYDDELKTLEMRSQQIAREIEATTQKKKEETVDKDQTKLEVKTTPDPKKNRVKMGL
jgi:N12 class adenine-specific DNA methylase